MNKQLEEAYENCERLKSECEESQARINELLDEQKVKVAEYEKAVAWCKVLVQLSDEE